MLAETVKPSQVKLGYHEAVFTAICAIGKVIKHPA